jgi:disulfide bond formation protein DsbB
MTLDALRRGWPIVTLGVSAALLAAAHAFERFGGLRPCPLCLDQREWHWGVVAASVLGLAMLRWRPSWSRLVVLGLGLVLAGSAYMGAFHVAVEQGWIIYRCDAAIDLNDITTFSLDGPTDAPQCDEIAWSLFGISMAGYNALISGAMALASFVLALWPERKA